MGHGVLPTHQQGDAQFPVGGGLAWNSLAGASLCIYASVRLRSRAVSASQLFSALTIQIVLALRSNGQ
jgi:hypothetical protein